MAHIVRTFTSDVTLQNRVNDLLVMLTDDESIKHLLPELIRQPNSVDLDDRGLLPEDYAQLYKMLGPQHIGPLNSDAFNKARAERFKGQAKPEDDAQIKLIAQVIKARARRNYTRAAVPPIRVNYSRVLDALINIGIIAFEDRLREYQRSKASNAGASQTQFTKQKARRAVAA
jgi:hypothetical protein